MEQNKVATLQIQFLNRIKSVIDSDKSIVFELSELLGVSTDSIYRRLRGETWLTIEEISILCKNYNLNFDIITESTSDRANFQYSLMKNVEEYMAHWISVLNILKQIESGSEKQIIYAAIDIPIFYHFNYPELASFKLFYWMREVVNEPILKDVLFDLEWIEPKLIEQRKEIYTTYCQIPSVEIWTDSTANSLLKQIEYYWDMGLFANKELALKIIDRSIEELELINKQAELCTKKINEPTREENFKFYQCDIEVGNNSVYVKTDNIEAVYMGILTFNTMVTSNEAFCKTTHEWLSNITRKSTLLSGIAQKQRYQFFKNITKRFELLKNRILETE